MGLYNKDWTLQYAQTREGELYREKKRLEQDLEDSQRRSRQEDYERENQLRQEAVQRERDREARREERWNLMSSLDVREKELENLRLCIKFGINDEHFLEVDE